MVKTFVSRKGQTTIPANLRKRWKSSKVVIWETNPDGSAIVRPVPDVSSLLGIANNGVPKDPQELEKAYQAIAKDTEQKGPKL